MRISFGIFWLGVFVAVGALWAFGIYGMYIAVGFLYLILH